MDTNEDQYSLEKNKAMHVDSTDNCKEYVLTEDLLGANLTLTLIL